jgi:hypothetical protein
LFVFVVAVSGSMIDTNQTHLVPTMPQIDGWMDARSTTISIIIRVRHFRLFPPKSFGGKGEGNMSFVVVVACVYFLFFSSDAMLLLLFSVFSHPKK